MIVLFKILLTPIHGHSGHGHGGHGHGAMVDMGMVAILKDNTHSWEHLSLVDLAASSKLLPRGKSWKCRWGF